MKKLIAASLLLIWWLPQLGVLAQTGPQTASPLSQRYSLTVPEGWFISSEPQDSLSQDSASQEAFSLADMQNMIPQEILTIADSEGTVSAFLAKDFDFTAPENYSDLEGSVLFTFLLPDIAADIIFQLLGGSPDSLFADLDLPADSHFEAQVEDVELAGLTGDSIRVSDGAITLSMIFLSDNEGDTLWAVWASDSEHLSDLENVIASLSYQTYDLEALTNAAALNQTVNIVPDLLEIDMPSGWWAIQSPNRAMVWPPPLNSSFVDRLGGDLQGEEGIVLVVIQLDRDLFSAETYDENRQLNPDLIRDLFTLLLQQEAPDEQAYTRWSNAGLEGLATEIDQEAEQETIYYALLVDTGDRFTVLVSMSAADTWDTYEDVVRAIFNTCRPIEE